METVIYVLPKNPNNRKETGQTGNTSVSDCSKKSILLLLISLAGLLVSLMSGFQESIPFLKSLCSNACKDTAEIHFLHMPLWLLGALFYSAAAMLALFRRRWPHGSQAPLPEWKLFSSCS